MALLIFVVALALLGIAANVFGAYSGESITSDEHRLARQGFTRG